MENQNISTTGSTGNRGLASTDTNAPAASTSSSIADSGNAEPQAGPSTKKIITRKRTGCYTCRSRRTKCDEQKDTCGNCVRLGLQCDWVKPTASTASGSASTLQMTTGSGSALPAETEDHRVHPYKAKRPIACNACRASRTRCSQQKPKCSRCVDLDLNCVYNQPKTSTVRLSTPTISQKPESEINSPPTLANQAVASTSAYSQFGQPSRSSKAHITLPLQADTQRGDASPIPTGAELRKYIDAYFTYVHPTRSNPILHRGTLLREIRESTASPSLLLTICAVTARFMEMHQQSSGGPTDSDGGSQAASWAIQAKNAIMENLNEFSLDNLACVLLLQYHELLSNRWGSQWVLVSMAVRMAYALQLHKEPPTSLPWAEQEYRRRLMWSCWWVDGYASDGAALFTCCPPGSVKVQLPCTERNYTLQKEVRTQFLDTEGMVTLPTMGSPAEWPLDPGGLFNHTLRLTPIRFKVIGYIKHIEQHLPFPWENASLAQSIVLALQNWHSSLPSELQWSVANLYARQETGQITPFMLMHVTYHNCFLMLYRTALPGSKYSASDSFLARAPSGWIQQARDNCFEHCSSICRLVIEVIEQFPEELPTDPSISITIHEVIRCQLAYLKLAAMSNADTLKVLADVSEGFKKLYSLLGRMWTIFPLVRPLLKAVDKLLRDHGFTFISQQLSDNSQPSRIPTPEAGCEEEDNYHLQQFVPRKPPTDGGASISPQSYGLHAGPSPAAAAGQPLMEQQAALTHNHSLGSAPPGVTQAAIPYQANNNANLPQETSQPTFASGYNLTYEGDYDFGLGNFQTTLFEDWQPLDFSNPTNALNPFINNLQGWPDV